MTKPLISIIIPVYNVQDHVADCIASLRAQTLADFEAIVVDDGSTDDSADIARQAIADDPRFRLIRQDNRGLSGARNTGLDLVQGHFIAFVDSDDRVASGYLYQMWRALEETGADWVACGIRFCFPDGTSACHSAIHGQAGAHSSGRVTRFPLTGWDQAIRHFPSAWNKLYRRSLIEGLRFPEGTWFEDHGFFYRAAARTDHIAHLEEPLYLQTRGRAGQITGADDDRVFEQFAVLEDIRTVMGAGHPGGAQAFGKIASRLLFERSTALRDPQRRARYARACADYLAQHGLDYAPDWDPHISRAWGLEMSGTLPLSVVIPWSGQAPDLLTDTLKALAAQGAPGREVLIICDTENVAEQARNLSLTHVDTQVIVQEARGAGAARNAGLKAARGAFVTFVDAGDQLAEMALHEWVDGLIVAQGDFAVSAFRQGVGTGDTHCGFHDQEAVSRAKLAAAPFVFTPEQAILLDAQPSSKLYRRAFLLDENIRFGTGPLPGWQVALKAALAAKTALYFQWPGCDVNQTPRARSQFHRRWSAGQLVRALDRLAACLTPAQAARLPLGWQRRLYARALWAQLYFSEPRRGKIGQVLFAASAGWAALRRRQTRNRTALDPYMGPRIEQLLSTEALLRRSPTAMVAPDGGTAHNAGDLLQNTQDLRMLSFFVQGAARLRYKAEFSDLPYANISFFDRDQGNILFHLSLRQEDGLAVCNKRIGADWGKELHHKVTLPREGVDVEISFVPPVITVKLDGQQVFKFGGELLRRRFSHLDQIAYVDFQGGIVSSGMDIDISLGGGATPGQLSLNSRLELRTRLETPATDLSLIVPGMTTPPPMIQRELPDGQADLRALLPGRVWDYVAADAPLEVGIVRADGADACPRLRITRPEMATQIEALLAGTDLKADALAAMQVLEHIRFGGLGAHLSPQALAALTSVQRFYDLADYLEDSASAEAEDTAALPALVAESDPVVEALAQFGQTMRAAPETDPLELVQQLAQDLPKDLRPYLFLGLSEYFCDPARDFDAFHALFVAQGYAGVLSPDPEDVWKSSTLLPFLFLEGQIDVLRPTLWALSEPSNDWTVTPAVAWVAQRAMDGTGISEEDAEDILYAYMALVDNRIWDYWGRAHCVALTGAAVALGLNCDRFADYMQPSIFAFICRAYGLSRQFWQMLDAALNGAPVPVELIPARAAFDLVERSARDGQACAGLDQALDLFSSYGTPETLRMRRELLGPSGLQLADGAAPDYAALTRAGLNAPEATVRHMAFPGTAQVGEDLVTLAAETLPGLYPEVPRAPYYQRQVQIGHQIHDLLKQAAKMPVRPDQITALAADLQRLSGPRSQFLGQALILALIRGISSFEGHAETLATLMALLEKTTDALEDWHKAALQEAPAPRLALQALRDTDGTDILFTQVAGILPDLAQSLPDPTPLPEGRDDIAGSPLFDTIVTVFSCLPNLTTRVPPMRAGWLSLLAALDVPYVIVVGNGDGQIDGDVLHLDAPDDYEGLPQKTLATIRWVHDNTRFAHLLKIDDDCFLNPDVFFNGLSYRKFDYYGRILTRHAGQTDRAWHNEKSTSDRGRFELDKSPEPSSYADGGGGYTLSRRAMAAVLDALSSPEGQALEQVSFMEDKLLGDLLALRGIRPADEDHRVSVRRRTHAKAHPVSRWVNSFDSSRAAPISLVHQDDLNMQLPAMVTLEQPVLTPKKIWPSYQDVQLVYQSNALELISPEDRLEAARTAEVAVVACMRNEMFMLPQFLAHYRKLGVGSFLIVDNCSDDGTLEYLLDQPDVALFSVDTDYNLSFYGVAWQQALMAAFRVGKWSLVADADELLVWQENQTQTLPDLLKTDAFQDVDAARIFMLDMYPQGSLAEARFKTDPFAETGFVDREPFLANWTGQGPFSNMPTWTSALRHRLIPGSRTDLFVAQKIALLKYQPWMRVSAGLHFLTDVTLSSRELLFAHFKYNADFRRKALAEVARGQHFNDAEEYRKYLALMSEGRDVIYEDGLSVPWTQAPFVKSLLS